MPNLDRREQEIITAIKENHRLTIERQMQEHTNNFNQSNHSSTTTAWVGALADIKLLTDHYLETIAHSANDSTEENIANNSGFSSYISGIGKAILPEKINKALFDNSFFKPHKTIFTSLTGVVFSIALGHSITCILLNYYISEFAGDPDDAQKKFAEIIEKNTSLSKLIQQECERISVDLIKLFHFREMLLLGKMTQNPIEPDARANFISQAQLQNESTANINTAIEIYFTSELSKIFNTGFKSLYQVQEFEIKNELAFPVKKWLHHLFDSHAKRLAFTQEIQMKFMQLSTDFLLEQKNQPGLLATYPIFSAVIAGLIVSFVLSLALAFVLSSLSVVGIALMGGILSGIGAYFLIKKNDHLAYKRDSVNREHIQQSIERINSEYLAIEKQSKERKETSVEVIKNTKHFGNINATFFNLIDGRNVARGSVSGWLREYAARYRHSHAIEVDLGGEYKELMMQSKGQNKDLIKSINEGNIKSLTKWIINTQTYLKQEDHKKVIAEFELVQKIKEQVLEIVSQIKYFPPALLEFYCAPLSNGGLAGNESDFAHCHRLAPKQNDKVADENPYQALCDTALKLFKKDEPLYLSEPFLYGDAEYRHMLGIAAGSNQVSVTNNNIEQCLNNSYIFLLSLCNPIKPGHALDPLQQTAMVSDEFILYRMLLLKQLANLCSLENNALSAESKLKIKDFVTIHFNKDPDIIFDDLINQKFLLNKDVQTSLTYKNSDGFTVTEAELDNITQAIRLDIAYNSVNFKLKDVLGHYRDQFSSQRGILNTDYFAHEQSEQELNPQCTEQYVLKVNKYCSNTTAFLEEALKNKALTKTNVLACYRYNVSLQVYKAQIRIVESLKKLSKESIEPHVSEKSNHLLCAFSALEQFAVKHCYALKKESPLRKMEKLVHKQTNKNAMLKDWVDQLDNAEMLLQQLDNVTSQLHQPFTRVKAHTKTDFFKLKEASLKTAETKGAPIKANQMA